MPGSHVWSFIILVFLLSSHYSDAWDTDEMELFDLVEEVNGNFYDILGVEQTSAVADIKRAYRRLSVKYHPDENKEEGAEEKFRQIVAIYEVLKDEERRKQYDNILIYGLPDWKQPVYYYRKVRKLGFIEMCVALLIILTIGHFLVVWSIYLERKFEMQEIFDSRRKKEKKGRKRLEQERKENEKFEAFQEELDALPKPKLIDLIPVQMIRGIWWIIISSPSWIVELKERLTSKTQVDDINEDDDESEKTKQRRRQRIEVPDSDFKPELAQTAMPVVYTEQNRIVDEKKRESEKVVDRTGKEWTDEEIALLAKAVARFPAGVSGRWEKIAEFTGRSVTEVTKMSKQLKSSFAMNVDPSAQGITGQGSDNIRLKKGNRPGDDIISERFDFGNPSLDDMKVVRKRSKVQADAKTADRTLLISCTQPSQVKQSPKSDGDNTTTLGAGAGHNTQQTTEQKLTVDNTKVDSDSLVWSQNQQKILEWALTQYPKGTTERWEKIAEHIPGKTKENCVARFKYLAEIVKKRKAAANTDSSKIAS